MSRLHSIQAKESPMDESSSQREMTRQSFLKESDYYRISSPLFSTLGRACADDEDILEMCSVTRRGQAAGILLQYVAQYLLLKAPDPKLAQYFPSLTPTPKPPNEAFRTFREFCLDRRSEVMELLSWRTVNTNLVEKASCLVPALRHVERLVGEPLTLVEICCSSGLNLLFDEWHYDYGPEGRIGAQDSPVRLSCKVIGGRHPPVGALPRIAERLGVDLVTVDPSDPLERLWMESVLCPEWTEERKRLKAALEVRVARELRTIKGNALDILPSLLEKLPGSLCILQTYCMGHWSATEKLELEELLTRASRRRDIHRVGIEMPERESPLAARERLAKLSAAGIPVLQKSFHSPIEHMWYTNGDVKTRVLGQGDGFGVWLDWQAPEQ
jgi:hypothetical protein